ncbi:MAG: ABC-F family ATP-binding cassette domain-containing protein [Gemmatimonadales bacterium]
MSLLSVSAAAVRFGHTTLFERVTFLVERGDRWGIVGRNGSGKTTLMELIQGLREPDDGTIARANGLRIAVMDQYRDFGNAETVWAAAARGFSELFALEQALDRQLAAMSAAGEAVTQQMLDRYADDQERFERAGGYEATARVDAVLAGLGFDPEVARTRDVATLSGGERGRLSLAGQLAAPADLLILDEPTNHLDLATARWLEGYLREIDEAVLLISHDRAFLGAVVDHVLHLEGTTATAYTGGYDAFVRQRAERRAAQERAVRKQEAKLAAEEDYIRRNIAGGNSAQAKGRRRRLARVERLSPPPGAEGVMAVAFEAASRGGDQLLVADRLRVAIGERELVAPWSGTLRRGDVVGLIGHNGAGKSTFLATVLGLRPADGGQVRLMPSVQVAYYRQDLGDVDPAESLYDLIAHRRATWTRGQVQGHLGRFGFSGDEVLRRAGTLSGGERARVALALMMLEHANLLVFDEPTNHLDVESIEALEDALADYDGTVLLVSHDRALLDTLTTRIWSIEDGQLRDYPGGFADWEEDAAARGRERAAVAREEKQQAARSRPATPREDGKARAAELRRLEREVEAVEARVATLEADLASVEAALADPALYGADDGPARAAELAARRDRLRGELDGALGEWERVHAARDLAGDAEPGAATGC